MKPVKKVILLKMEIVEAVHIIVNSALRQVNVINAKTDTSLKMENVNNVIMNVKTVALMVVENAKLDISPTLKETVNVVVKDVTPVPAHHFVINAKMATLITLEMENVSNVTLNVRNVVLKAVQNVV